MVSDCIIGVRVKNPSLEVLEQGEIILADGSRKAVPYAGPVQIRFKNRQGFNGADRTPTNFTIFPVVL
jgi:hypothetical protein